MGFFEGVNPLNKSTPQNIIERRVELRESSAFSDVKAKAPLPKTHVDKSLVEQDRLSSGNSDCKDRRY